MIDQEVHTEQPLSILPLRRPPFWSVGLLLVTGLVCMVAGNTLLQVAPSVVRGEPAGAYLGPMIAAAVLLLLMGGVLAYRIVSRAKPFPPLRFLDDVLELPNGPHSAKAVKVAYGDLIGLHLGGHTMGLRVFIESKRKVFFLDQESFFDPDGPEMVYRELRRRVGELPDGQDQLARMAVRQSLALEALARRPLATHGLLGLIAVFYINQILGGGVDGLGLLRWGANSAPLVAEGEWFRLLSASFLHGGVILHLHVVLNGAVLWLLGGLMERLLGWARFLVVYLLAGLGATSISALMGTPNSVGASGAVLGLFGSLAVVHLLYRIRLPLFFRQPPSWWVFIIGLNVLLALLAPFLLAAQLDTAGHLGGMAVGALATWLLLRKQSEVKPAAPSSLLVRGIAIALCVLYAVGLGQAVWHAANADETQDDAYFEMLVSQPDLDAGMLNNMAWYTAIDRHASPERLAMAERAARRAVELEPESPGVRDTMATVLYRLERYQEAVEMQRQVVEALAVQSGQARDPQAPTMRDYATQLARFLSARIEHQGPILDSGLSSEQVKLRIKRPISGPAYFALDFEGDSAAGLTLYALLHRGKRPAGLLRFVAANPSGETFRFESDSVELDPSVKITLAIVERGTVVTPNDGNARWDLWPANDEVADYP